MYTTYDSAAFLGGDQQKSQLSSAHSCARGPYALQILQSSLATELSSRAAASQNTRCVGSTVPCSDLRSVTCDERGSIPLRADEGTRAGVRAHCGLTHSLEPGLAFVKKPSDMTGAELLQGRICTSLLPALRRSHHFRRPRRTGRSRRCQVGPGSPPMRIEHHCALSMHEAAYKSLVKSEWSLSH